MKADILKFLLLQGPDYKGRALQEMWAMTNQQLEETHDVIQWMFPTDIASQYSGNAPVLTDEQVNTMWRNEGIRASIRKSEARFAQFLEDTRPSWLTPRNHNYLRITRVLRCLWNMRMGEEFFRWREYAAELGLRYEAVIGRETLLFWANAHNDSFMKPPTGAN